ncbi:hypothetical protein [Cupriavidus necator]
MLPSKLSRTWAATWIAAALLAACGGDDGTSSSADVKAPAGQPGQPGNSAKPDKRADPVFRCAP